MLTHSKPTVQNLGQTCKETQRLHSAQLVLLNKHTCYRFGSFWTTATTCCRERTRVAIRNIQQTRHQFLKEKKIAPMPASIWVMFKGTHLCRGKAGELVFIELVIVLLLSVLLLFDVNKCIGCKAFQQQSAGFSCKRVFAGKSRVFNPFLFLFCLHESLIETKNCTRCLSNLHPHVFSSALKKLYQKCNITE